ncbi:MAG: hypothetical protein IJP71_00910 [Lachnospiraceae bacterium]|nr:hypothetical protein [Lachnospiraceae bacterium]
MKDRYTKEDFKRGIVENYSGKFSIEEKILMTIKAYLAEGEIANKKELRREVDALLV